MDASAFRRKLNRCALLLALVLIFVLLCELWTPLSTSCTIFFQGLPFVVVRVKPKTDFGVVSDDSGAYSVHVGNEIWLTNGPTFFRANGREYSSKDGSLKLLNKPTSSQGIDAFGTWKENTYNYSADASNIATSIRIYNEYSAAVFSQTFVSGVGESSRGDASKVISGFPCFKVGNSTSSLGYLAYGGVFVGWNNLAIGRWNDVKKRMVDGLDSGPLVLFDQNDRVLIISPFNNFMAASFWHDTDNKTVNWGIMGRVNSVTQGYTYSTIVFYDSHGINKAIERWGKMMRTWYKRKSSSRELDPSVNYIGYYTDNGGYYYQRPEPGINFEETLLRIYNYSRTHDLPYRYLQYDDWFYPTAGPTSYGATVIWDAKPSVFPDGLIYLYNKTKLPVVAHNRYWSDQTPYAVQNGGPFTFVFDEVGNAIPDDQGFWDELFAKAKSWGLLVYEQDWLNYQIDSIGPVQVDLTLGTRWLHQMGSAAERNGIFLQYCMAFPRHLLASLEIPSVSQIRVSIDYQLWSNQYQIGLSSIFAHALGVAPFKDNFWTMRNQPGNRYNKTEENPHLQAVISLLSTGPVGVSDRIGYTDLDLVQRLVREDGLLLKPSRPATAIDAQVLQAAFGGKIGPVGGDVWTTYSQIGNLVFGVVLGMNLAKPYTLRVADGSWDHHQLLPSVAYSSRYFMPSSSGEPVPFDADHPLLLSDCNNYTQLCFFYTSPIFHIRGSDVYIKGEMAKALPMSPKRVLSIAVSSDDLTVVLAGTPSEPVDFHVCTLSSDLREECKVFGCVVSDGGTARLSTALGLCQ